MSGVWYAKVTRINGGYVYVTVPRLTGSTEHGPLEPLYGVAVTAGTSVLVGLLEGNPNRLVLLRRF